MIGEIFDRCTFKNNYNTNLKIGILFDGIDVFLLSASRYGIIPTRASEIEIPPVHIITFDSPCQNLSNIGKHKGLAGN